MADNVTLDAGTGGAVVATDDVGGLHYQWIKLAFGGDDTATKVTSSTGLPVNTELAAAAALSDTYANPTTAPVGAFLMAYDGSTDWERLVATSGSLHVTVQNSVVSVDDNSGSLTVDNAGTFAVQAAQSGTWNIGTVTSVTSATVVNAGTFAVQVNGDALTALQLIDDAIYVDDADWTDSTSKHMLVGGLYQSTPQTVTDGDVAPFQVDSNGNLKIASTDIATIAGAVAGSEMQVDVVTLPNVAQTTHDNLNVNANIQIGDADVGGGNPVPVSDNGGSLTVDGTVAVTNTNLDNGHSEDFDTGGGTDTTTAFGIAVPASGGAVVVSGSAANGLEVDVTQVQGSVTVAQSTHDNLNLNANVQMGNTDVSSSAPLHVQVGDGTTQATVRNLAANDALNVSIVDGSGNQITSFGGSGGTAETDDAAFTAGTGSGTPIMGFATSDAVDSGDVGVLAMDTSRNLKVSVEVANTGVGHETDSIYQGTTARTPVFASIAAASSGDNTLVAAQGASNKIRVVSLVLVADGAVDVRFESGAAGTALTGQMALTTNSGFTLPYNPVGWFETAANTLLNLELSAAVGVNGCLTYIVVT